VQEQQQPEPHGQTKTAETLMQVYSAAEQQACASAISGGLPDS
jgi:hypothetical protein